MPNLKPFAVATVAAVLASGALAQQPQAPASSTAAPSVATTGALPAVADLREVNDDNRIVQPWNLSVDRVEDMDIYGSDGAKIAEVDEVLENASGQIVGLKVEFGGVLGLGEREVVMSLDQIQLQGDRLMTSLTRPQLEALPRWRR